MKVLDLKRIEGNHFKAVLTGEMSEWYTKKETVFIEDKRYIIRESKCRDFNTVPRVYDIILEHKPQMTKNNYSAINFMHVFEITRESPRMLHIHQHQLVTQVVFDTPEECLNEFLQLKKMHKEALSSG